MECPPATQNRDSMRRVGMGWDRRDGLPQTLPESRNNKCDGLIFYIFKRLRSCTAQYGCLHYTPQQ